MTRLLLLAALVGCALAAESQYQVKAGEKLELDLGKKGIKVWQRTTNFGGEETTRFCGPTERNVACGRWVDEKLNPGLAVRVTAGGKLVIDKVTLGDAGSYYSPDDKPKATKNKDGTMSAVEQSMIIVTVTPADSLILN